MKLTKQQSEEAQELCYELPVIANRLMRAGMTETAHAVQEAVKKSGYELAEKASWS